MNKVICRHCLVASPFKAWHTTTELKEGMAVSVTLNDVKDNDSPANFVCPACGKIMRVYKEDIIITENNSIIKEY